MNLDALVLRAGDRVQAWGRLVRNARGTWFDPPAARLLMLMDPRPVVQPFSGAVPVTGADFDAVSDRYELGSGIEGWATVTGTWTGRLIRIERQASSRLPAPDDPPRWQVPPCPPPPGGWPRGMNGRYPDNLEFDVGDLRETGAAVMIVMFRPSPDQAVLVVAAADPQAVEGRLRPQLGPRLCVVPSRWTKREIDAVHARLFDRMAGWDIYQLGIEALEDAQARVIVKLTRVLPEIAAWAASLPPGILGLDPWLLPAREGRATAGDSR
jgi:hypothetical protein